MTIGRVVITDGEMLSNEAIAHFKLPEKSSISTKYLFLYFKSFDFDSLGSTSSIATAVNSKTIREMPVLNPDRFVVERFDSLITPLFEEIKNKLSEIKGLESTRDTLLPKLLSGELSPTTTEAA